MLDSCYSSPPLHSVFINIEDKDFVYNGSDRSHTKLNVFYIGNFLNFEGMSGGWLILGLSMVFEVLQSICKILSRYASERWLWSNGDKEN